MVVADGTKVVIAVTTVVVHESGSLQSFQFEARVVVVVVLDLLDVLLLGSQALQDGSLVLVVLEMVRLVVEDVVLVLLEDQPSQP